VSKETVVYRAAGVFDGVNGQMVRGAVLVVRGGVVEAVGREAEVAPPGARVNDLVGYLVPGFVDAHTHVTIRPGEGRQHWQLVQPSAWQAIRGVANVEQMLRSGVTTARIMTEDHGIDYQFRDAIARGEIAGPRLLVAGLGMSPPGGHGSASGGVAGVGPLREGVRKRVADGADHIKIFTTGGVSSSGTSLMQSNYSAEEIDAIVDEARSLGRVVSAHAHGGAGVTLAVQNGIHSIEHGALLSDENVAEMAAAGTWLTLTHSILCHPDGIERGDAGDASIIAKVMEARAAVSQGAHRLREAGIRVAVGTDSMHGYISFEAEWLVEHGWTATEALLALTRNGGELIGDPTVGVLRPGARADFVELDGDPVADIAVLAAPRRVYREGVLAAERDGSVHAFQSREPTA
jgi:imidazolonepropionase-like amidohydrolase